MPAKKRKGECPHCQGIGFLIEENQAVPCECQQELRRELRLRQAKIPRKFSAKSLANFETDEKGLDACPVFIFGKGKVILILKV